MINWPKGLKGLKEAEAEAKAEAKVEAEAEVYY